MRHRYFGKKLSRTKNERRRLLQNLAREVISRGSVHTTLAKAKAVQPLLEKLVTKAKKADRASIRIIEATLAHKQSERLLLADAQTRFASRGSGFTRIVKLGQRRGDASETVLLQFVDERVETTIVSPKKETSKTVPEQKSTTENKEIKKSAKRKTLKKTV